MTGCTRRIVNLKQNTYNTYFYFLNALHCPRSAAGNLGASRIYYVTYPLKGYMIILGNQIAWPTCTYRTIMILTSSYVHVLITPNLTAYSAFCWVSMESCTVRHVHVHASEILIIRCILLKAVFFSLMT